MGSLTPGNQADIIIVGGGLGARPINDPVAQLVFQTTSAKLETVMVAGRIVKQGGRLVGIDLPKLLSDLDDSSRDVRERMATRSATNIGPSPAAIAAMPAWTAANLAR